MLIKTSQLPTNLRLATLLVAAIILLETTGAFATTYYWDCNGSSTTPTAYGTAGGTWSAPTAGSSSQGWSTSTTGNVTPGSVTTASGDTASFGYDGTHILSGGTVMVSGTVTCNTIQIASGSGPITLTGGIAINLGTGSLFLNQNGNVINTPIALQGNGWFGVWNITGGGTVMTFNGPISGSGFGVTLAPQAANVTPTFQMNGTNTYSGTTYIGNSGGYGATLALGANGSISNSALVEITAGATFDVSAKNTFNLSSSTTLKADGTGTTATTQATLKGGTTVNLGSQPITLTWAGATLGTDTAHPCLVVSQGALTLNNNAITINDSSLIGPGIYTLISVTGGTINGSPNAMPTGTAIDVTKTNVISVSGGSVILTVTGSVTNNGPYYWDGNDSAAGFGTAGGTWAAPTAGTPSSGWSTSSAGTATVNGNSITTGIGDALNLGYGANGLAAGTITISGSVNAGSLNFGSASGGITLSGGQITLGATAGITNNGPTQTINSQLSGAGSSLTFASGSCNFKSGGAGANNTTGDLYLIGGGLMEFYANNTGWGAGKNAYIVNGTTVQFYSSAGDGLGGSGGYTLNLGDSNGTGGNISIANSATCANPIVVPAGSVGSSIWLYDNGGTPAISGNITAHENFSITFASSGNNGKTPSVSGSACSIDANKTVTFTLNGANGDRLTDSAIWGGAGAVTYTCGTAASTLFFVSGAKTYSGGCTINNFANGCFVTVSGSSTGSPNNVTSGPFGTGPLNLNDQCVLRASTSGDSTLGNPITLAGNVTFPTVAGETSLIFQGNVDLGAATPTLYNYVGSTVAHKGVWFQGVLSSSYPGVGLTLAGTGLTLMSGANTYTGDTTVSSGTLRLDANNVIPNGVGVGDVYLNGTLDLNGFSDAINGLNGAGVVDNSQASSSSILTVGYNDASGVFSGILQNSGSGATLALAKTGNGVLTLSGTNTYSGATTVNGGALLVNGLIGSGNVTVSGTNTTLGGTGTIGGALSVSAGGIVQPTLSGFIGGTLTLSSATSPNLAAGCTLQIRAPSSAVDQVVLTDPGAVFSCANLNLVIDTTGLSSNLTGVPIVSVANPSGISGTFASVTANNGCAVTVHYNPQSVTVDLQPLPMLATKLVFTSTAFTNTAGFVSGNITVQRQNNSGTPVTSDRTIFVNLASSSTNGTFTPASLAISNGTSSANFTYSDSQVGTPVITASSSPLTSATQQETIIAPPPPSPLNQAALAARKLAALTNEYNSPYPDPSTSEWGQTEYCVAAYTLNMGLATADGYVLGWNNSNSGSFDMINIDRIFADPVLNGRMGYSARTNLQAVLWNYLYANSQVSATTNVWNIAGSENLNLIQRSSCYLIAQVLQNTPGYSTKILSDGKTIQQHAASWSAYFRNYFWSRARKGLEVEMNSNTYTKYTLSCMYNLYDLTTDPVVKANGLNYLNLYWAEKAQSFLPASGNTGGSETRSYKKYISEDSFISSTYCLGWNNIGYSGHPGEQMEMVTSYSCPDTISALALYPKGRYLAAHSSWGEGTSASSIYYITFESDGSGGVVRLNYTTEAYVMSATCYRPDRAFVAEATQNRLMGVDFNNGSDRIVMNGLGTTQAAGNETGYCEVNGVAGTNCLILWRDPRVTYSSAERLYFSNGNMVNNLVTNGGWQFSQTANAYVAIRVANGGWTTGTDTNVSGGVMETLSDPWSPVIIECAAATDYASFAAFQNQIVTNSFSTNTVGSSYSVSYTSSASDKFLVYADSTTFPQMNGANFSYELPQTFLSPYLNGLGTSNTGTVTYSNYAALTLSFLTNSAPTLAAISNYTLMAGQTLKFTNSAIDANIPPLTLAYTLTNAPLGATVNPTNGVFTWRPAIAQSPSTNTIAVVVTGNNTPALSAAQSFNVTVTQPPSPTCSAPTLTNGTFSMQINGANGPDYILQASTNLASPLAWQTLLTTNMIPPFVFNDSAATNYSSRFYRVLLGP
jgi:autotransporter-associated beta strand protein